MSGESFKLYNQFVEALNDKQKKLFDDFLNKEMDVYAVAEILHFQEGFKIGMRLAMECLI